MSKLHFSILWLLLQSITLSFTSCKQNENNADNQEVFVILEKYYKKEPDLFLGSDKHFFTIYVSNEQIQITGCFMPICLYSCFASSEKWKEYSIEHDGEELPMYGHVECSDNKWILIYADSLGEKRIKQLIPNKIICHDNSFRQWIHDEVQVEDPVWYCSFNQNNEILVDSVGWKFYY